MEWDAIRRELSVPAEEVEDHDDFDKPADTTAGTEEPKREKAGSPGRHGGLRRSVLVSNVATRLGGQSEASKERDIAHEEFKNSISPFLTNAEKQFPKSLEGEFGESYGNKGKPFRDMAELGEHLKKDDTFRAAHHESQAKQSAGLHFALYSTPAYAILNWWDRSGRDKEAFTNMAKSEWAKNQPWSDDALRLLNLPDGLKTLAEYAEGLQSGIGALESVPKNTMTHRLFPGDDKGQLPSYAQDEALQEGVKGTYSMAETAKGALSGAYGSDKDTSHMWMQLILNQGESRARKPYGSAFGSLEGERLFAHGRKLQQKRLLARPANAKITKSRREIESEHEKALQDYIEHVLEQNQKWLDELDKEKETEIGQQVKHLFETVHPRTKVPFDGQGIQIVDVK